MFGLQTGADVTDGNAELMLPVTTMDQRVMLERAENIGSLHCHCLSVNKVVHFVLILDYNLGIYLAEELAHTLANLRSTALLLLLTYY